MSVTRKQITEVLKQHGLERIKLSKGGWGPGQSVAYRDCNNKMLTAVPCACHGPMTVTNAHREAIDKKRLAIYNAFYGIGLFQDLSKENGVFVVARTKKTVTHLRLMEQWVPQYTRSAGYDESYKQIVLVPVYTKEAVNA